MGAHLPGSCDVGYRLEGKKCDSMCEPGSRWHASDGCVAYAGVCEDGDLIEQASRIEVCTGHRRGGALSPCLLVLARDPSSHRGHQASTKEWPPPCALRVGARAIINALSRRSHPSAMITQTCQRLVCSLPARACRRKTTAERATPQAGFSLRPASACRKPCGASFTRTPPPTRAANAR